MNTNNTKEPKQRRQRQQQQQQVKLNGSSSSGTTITSSNTTNVVVDMIEKNAAVADHDDHDEEGSDNDIDDDDDQEIEEKKRDDKDDNDDNEDDDNDNEDDASTSDYLDNQHHRHPTKGKTKTRRAIMEPMEIEKEDGIIEEDEFVMRDVNESYDDGEDLEELLPNGDVVERPNSKTSINSGDSSDVIPDRKSSTTTPLSYFQYYYQYARLLLVREENHHGPMEKVGNMRIFVPKLFFRRTKWGIMGPHWFGPLCVLGIILFASTFFIKQSLQDVGIGTALICTCFTIATIYHLINASFRDPGVVVLQQQQSQSTEPVSRDYRWCDVCEVYQPPDGAHCPDCNVCVAGFDHHCVWMGTCIGKNNFRPFMKFNQSWLLYLLYAIVWVSIFGPKTNKSQ